MLGPFRRRRILAALGWASMMSTGFAQAQTPANPPTSDSPAKPSAGDFGLPGEDPPKAFVPVHPRTVEEQKRVEALRYYAAGRAYEDRRQFTSAIGAFEKALESQPDSSPVLRRLSRINFALGRDEDAVALGRRILVNDPGDVETLELLLRHLRRDPPAAEALLLDVSKNPKLDKKSIGGLYVEFELGGFFEASLQFDKAAVAFERVVEAIDDKANSKITPADLRRFLGEDPAQAYLRFGNVFLQAKKLKQAIKAFERGLVYDPDEPLLLIDLAKAYLAVGRPEEALRQVEQFLKRQPQGREMYDQLALILTTLKRGDEIIPRLEKYASESPKNIPLKYALAEQYNLAGQPAKAQAIFNRLLDEQRDTQGFADNFPKLLKERKPEELLQLLTRVFSKFPQIDAIQPQIDLLIADPAMTELVLDTGLKMLASNPPSLDVNEGFAILKRIANEAKRFDKLADLIRWSIPRVPNPFMAYYELIKAYIDAGQFDEAEKTWREWVEKFPGERNGQLMVILAEIQEKSGKIDAAIATLRDAMKLDPNDTRVLRALASLLAKIDKLDDAVILLQGRLKIDPNDPDVSLFLGYLLSRAKRYDQAIAVYKAMIERFANRDEIVKEAHRNLSIVYSDMNDFPKAEAELEAIIARDPDDTVINNDLGYLYADQGKNLEKAEAMIRKAVADEPENSSYLDSLGWVLFKRGKFQEARIPLEKAQADAREDDATIPDHLGDVYFQLQELPKAKAAWERALKVAGKVKPPDKKLGEIKRKLESLQNYVPSPKPKTGDAP